MFLDCRGRAQRLMATHWSTGTLVFTIGIFMQRPTLISTCDHMMLKIRLPVRSARLTYAALSTVSRNQLQFSGVKQLSLNHTTHASLQLILF